MSKMSELAAQLAELKRCGEILIGVSETLTEMFSESSSRRKETPKKATEATEEQPAEAVAVEEQKQPEEKAPTLEEVRAVLAEKSRAGHTAEVKALLEKHGASKLSGIAPKEYPALLAEAEVL